MIPRRSGIVLFLALLAGCGGDDGSNDERNGEPRVEGRWRVIYTPRSGLHEDRVTWGTTPHCAEGTCGFTINSTGGGHHRFSYDSAINDWSGIDEEFRPCLDDRREVVLEKGYRLSAQISLTASRVVTSADGTFVSEMVGERRDEVTLTPGAKAAGCDFAPNRRLSVRAVRIDPPAGDEKTVETDTR